MYLIFGILLIIIELHDIFGSLSIVKVVLRVPREYDIGLIFDICVSNPESDKKEVIEFLIRPDGGCFLNLTKDHMMCNAGRIVGANFGSIEAGTVETVSLIWPTVSLFNRVGYCSIVLTSMNSNKVQTSSKQIIHFDTRFETLDPDGHNLRKRTDFTDCKNWDKEYFKNCIPVNCEERYFGRRSYYNHETQQCEEVTRCIQTYEIYDEFANECIDTKHIYDEDDIDKIRKGNYEKGVLHLRPTYLAQLSDFTANKERDDELRDVVTDDLLTKRQVVREADSNELETDSSSTLPYWMQGLANGLLIVFATIAIYVLICFIIFLIVSWLSRRQSSEPDLNCCLSRTLSASDEEIVIYTTSSLMSQR